MLKNIWKCIIYVLGGEMEKDHMETYIKSRNPKNETERLNAICEYRRLRGGF